MKQRFFSILLCVCMLMCIVSIPAAAASKGLPDEVKAIASEYEWEVLKLVNIERANSGLQSLSMVSELQASCDIRAVELETSFSHTRPNGSGCYTTIPKSFPHKGAGENAAKGQTSPEEVVESWMKSSGHRANILSFSAGYMGVGYAEKENTWIQQFTARDTIVDCKVSTDLRSLNSREISEVYLILTTANGYVSYMPLSFEAMKEENGNYTPRINAPNLPVFTYRYGPATQSPAPPAPTEDVGEISFTDVPSDAYYAKAVAWAVKKNITSGTSDTTFSPDDTCTRAQILTFLWRAVGSPKAEGSNPFTDVKNGHYYYDAAIWAYQKGMIEKGRFSAVAPCTRASTVMYLWKNAGSPDAGTINTFTDVPADAPYAKAVSWAVANGITSGTSDTTFSPDATCTRGQIVTFLNRAIK
ncbi:MAG: S-layer homology domain-containing protein [Clostridia bacterium]|nr:S-layer homology domain-containing protein [Clostridia bacterium]